MVQIKELKDSAMVSLDAYMGDMKDATLNGIGRDQQQAVDLPAKPFISLLGLVGEVYQVCIEPNCLSTF